MALVVEQRPEEELFVEENPTIYDTPYYVSRTNAANLPMVYKISNTKFPVNSEDIIKDVDSVSNNGGFAQLNLDNALYTFFKKGTVKVTNTTSYNGVWTIRQVIDPDTIVIDAPYVANETGNVQNYYNNYSTLVKIFAGLPEAHPLNSTNPMTLITDNPITTTPNSSNIATIDVSALVKSKLSLDNDYDVNDLNMYTAFYIEYSEQYDVSDGINVTTTTETFTADLYDGCDAGAANFVTNGDFATDLTGWDNTGTGNDWIFDTGAAQTSISVGSRNSKTLLQDDLGLTDGVEYTVSFDININTSDNVRLTVGLGFDIVYQAEVTGSNSISFDTIFDGNQTGSFSSVTYKVELLSTPATSVEARLDNVQIVNKLTNPCLAYIFGTHSALNPQSKYGGNMGEYVQNFNGGVFANKWLTLMEKPVLFKGNYFDLSTIIPQSVIQSAINSGGFFLQIIEFDKNKEVITETNYPITQNLGGGIYRFRLDDKTFNANTKEFTVQALRIPVNLFVDGDEGTFNATTDPNGNPPSDWNLEKDARAIINYDTTTVYEGAGSLAFESRSIFNDDFALAVTNDNNASLNTELQGFNALSVDYSGDFTIELRHRLDSFGGSFPHLFSTLFSSSSAHFFRLIYSTTSLVSFQYFADRLETGGARYKVLQGSITPNQFNHFVISFSSGNFVRLYVNGVQIAETLTDAIIDIDNFTYTKGGLHINIDNNNFNPQGYSTGLRIYEGYAADATDVSNLYNSNRKYPQTVPISMTSFLRKEYLLNQEQGREVNESENAEDATLLAGYTDAQLKFGGGAWVDVTGIS